MFKKLSAVLVNSCCIMSIATTGMITAGAANDRMIGDVDMNGYVDAMDAASILLRKPVDLPMHKCSVRISILTEW